MLKEAKVQSKIIKEDLTYLIDIIKPELIAQLIIDYRDNDLDSVPEFMEYKNLRYLMDLKNKENKIFQREMLSLSLVLILAWIRMGKKF